MANELSLNNILSDYEINNLFTDNDTQETPEALESPEQTENKETTEVDINSLFDEMPESVGSEDKEQEDTLSPEAGTSPNFYSSIAKALGDEGIFPDLDSDTISKTTTAEAFKELVDSQIRAGLDERQKRVELALSLSVEESLIRQYENTLNALDSITDSVLEDESDKGDNLRKNLIYQDFINRGYSKERATREVDKSIKGGTDIEDAKEALISIKDFHKQEYNNLLEEAKKAKQLNEELRKQQQENLKKSILQEKKVFGDLDVDKTIRQKAYDALIKPVYRTKEGEYLSEIQRYEQEHKEDFLKNVAIVYTLTNGFKNIDRLIGTKLKEERKRGLRELEDTLNNTSRTSDGSLRFVSNDPESSINLGWKLDI